MKQSFYGKLYAEGKPMPVLEPMCGTGLNLLPFLEAGADIDGLVFSCQKER